MLPFDENVQFQVNKTRNRLLTKSRVVFDLDSKFLPILYWQWTLKEKSETINARFWPDYRVKKVGYFKSLVPLFIWARNWMMETSTNFVYGGNSNFTCWQSYNTENATTLKGFSHLKLSWHYMMKQSLQTQDNIVHGPTQPIVVVST